MRAFKVKALSVGGKNKIFSSGETVYENNFPDNHVDELVVKGFLEEIKVTVSEEDLDIVSDENILDKIELIDEIEDVEVQDELAGKTHTSFSLAALRKKCAERNIEFKDSDTRKALFSLLVSK